MVTKTNPIEIKIEQKLVLDDDFLIVPEHLTDHNTNVTIDGIKKVCTVHNALANGEKVILARVQGGQKYIVQDRVV